MIDVSKELTHKFTHEKKKTHVERFPFSQKSIKSTAIEVISCEFFENLPKIHWSIVANKQLNGLKLV